MRKIGIFYHLYQFGDWQSIFLDQLNELVNSGLYDAADYIFVGVNGDEELPTELPKLKIYRNMGDRSTEYCTLKALYDYSCLQDSYVLFLHSKGVTWTREDRFSEDPGNLNLASNTYYWRKYLEYFSINKWKECIDLLKDYDCVGTELRNRANFSSGIHLDILFYSGGIWWANSNYIKTLNPNFITNNMIIGRFATELWIGTNNATFYNFWNSNRDLYCSPILPEEYIDVRESE
jgi:hypothetical protein